MQKLNKLLPFNSLQSVFAIKGKIFRQANNRKTIRFEHNGQGYFVKLHYGVGWREIIKNLLQLRLPVISAKTEWKAIHKLQQLQILTTESVAYGCEGINPATMRSFLITKELTYIASLEDFCQSWRHSPPSFSVKLALIKKVAAIAKTLHEHGMNHRDFYLCHFLLDASFNLYLIDLHRMQIRKRIPQRWRLKDISGLYFSALDIGLTQRDCLRFIKYYSDQTLQRVLQRDKKFWLQTRHQALRLYQKIFQRNPPEDYFTF